MFCLAHRNLKFSENSNKNWIFWSIFGKSQFKYLTFLKFRPNNPAKATETVAWMWQSASFHLKEAKTKRHFHFETEARINLEAAFTSTFVRSQKKKKTSEYDAAALAC